MDAPARHDSHPAPDALPCLHGIGLRIPLADLYRTTRLHAGINIQDTTPMAEPASKLSDEMTVAEFLAWNPGDGRMWQLVDGVPVAMALPSRRHNQVQGELGRLIGNHLLDQGSPCSVVPTPGVITPMKQDRNLRIPDLAVSCADLDDDAGPLPDPLLIVEVLSPSNQAETWINVWTYTMIPSVQEVLVLHTQSVRADLLHRRPDGTWPVDPERVTEGDVVLDSIGFRTPLLGLHRLTGLRRRTAG